ncbi:MBL fold metallo-hydrolase [Larkinella soli]|uniref:MBL fold metallo-hydrolase n=1 Tax=Larkinella soli TaxID=1770527 RepID=UPI000FFC42FF|nr:MBL fold metallo-hydrolase [Larkinella soli]
MKYFKFLLPVLMLGLSWRLSAQTDDFIIEQVADQVYAAIPKRSEKISATSTIIVHSRFLTVVEAQTDQTRAKALLRAIRERISALPIRYLILTHYHADHVMGTKAFLEENPGLTILAHPRTREAMALDSPTDEAWVVSWRNYLRSRIDEPAPTDSLKARQAGLRAYFRHLSDSPVVLPTLTVADSLTLHDVSADLQIRYLGEGHTTGDLVVFVPQARVLITGDLVHDFEPLFFKVSPDRWIGTLNRLEQIPFDHLVGGHGHPQRGKAVVGYWRSYIEEISGRVREGLRQGLSLEQIQTRSTPETLRSLLRHDYGRRIQQAREAAMTPTYIGPLALAVQSNIAAIYRIYRAQTLH